jgi:hypothetical protein
MASNEGEFQARVHSWMLRCFGNELTQDRDERNRRFLEEALELVQSLGCTKEQASTLVTYVFARPSGDPGQEVGGVAVTLAALCHANQLDMCSEATKEITRIEDPQITIKIREKQLRKPTH